MGQVKTRLGSECGLRKAAQLYRALLLDALAGVSAIKGSRLEAHFDPPTASRSRLERLVPKGARHRWTFLPQVGGGLGQRLSSAFENAFRSGAAAAVAVGSDCPLLRGDHLRTAVGALRTQDLVLGPARDGGYYLIGLSRPTRRLFQGIPWSTDRVLECTLARAAALGLTTFLLPELPDVDTLADVRALARTLAAMSKRQRASASFPKHTAEMVARPGW